MRKHTALTRTSPATMPIVGAVLAAAAISLLGGCTASTQSSAVQSTTTSGPAVSTATVTPSSPAEAPPTSSARSTGSSSSSSPAQPAPPCDGAQLSLSTSQDSAAGVFDYFVIEFVNQGSAPCTVEGYPGAAAYGVASSTYVLNSSRRLTDNVADHYTSPAPVTLAPGATASTILEWIDKPTASHPYADCLHYGAGTFGITAPNTTQTTHTHLPSDVCSDILVHPLVPGATGRQAG